MKQFDDVYAAYGDDVSIAFTVRDRNGDLVDLAGATATFRVANKGSNAQQLELTEASGISFASSVATVSFNTNSISNCDFNLQGIYDFIAQLRITKAGKSMVAAWGELHVFPLIQ